MNEFTNATQLLTEGKTEDAFIAFLSIVELSTQQLHQTKFLRQYIVNRPPEYKNSIDLIRKSIDQLEKILVNRPKPPVPPRPVHIDTKNLKRTRGNSIHFVIDEEDEEEDDETVDIVQYLNQPKKANSCSLFLTMDDVLSQTVVDPSNLAPAQTPTTDSLSIPTPSPTRDYIPNIPVPPLLAMHRHLQQQQDDNGILPKVRSLYMSAMTIPTMMEFSPGLFAYQLTLIESAIFRAIPREALLCHSARTPHNRIIASTDFFNFITRTIEHSILLPQEACRRAEILNRWVKVASKLLALFNYQTLKAVVSALGTPPIQRLRRTWECIPKKQINQLDMLSTLMSESDNYCQYRRHAQFCVDRPAVPFLGVFIHDLTYMSVAATNKQDARIQGVLNELDRFQRLPEYPQQPPPSFVHKKHLFRPVSNMLHFSSKGTTSAAACMVSEENQSEEIVVGLEQQLIMQFVLMRPWVTEKTIDMLSQLREPSKRPVSGSSPTHGNEETEERRSGLSGFWPFRKTTSSSSTTTTTPTPDLTWSEGEEDNNEDDLGRLLNYRKLSLGTKKSHHRSLSLPSKTTMETTTF
ncbi:ras GEF [Rhizopus microsporus ATCC 52813]|uniref:Ras GEF n=1 Tax=Rhizopus microsporus ATCC 52813 TaxID=1340429 RepID=A0A2G4SIT7_RHIZD|nr:ras GEF [Rhizopus microsporus ATCC 52813]PHZ08662.1 ras GEF [Rhizopus microsporus ATCC 52813]